MKQFLAFLGTSDYEPCCYEWPGRGRVENVKYIQTALVRLIMSSGWSPDRVSVAITERAGARHKLHLCDEFRQHGLPEPCWIKIPEGRTETELWKLFEMLVNQIEENDELVLDVTHSFRSLPVLATILLQYLQVVKKVRIRGVYYGAWEAGRTDESGHKTAPIFNLTPFLTLYDWALAIDLFQRTGDSRRLVELTTQEVRPLLIDTKGSEADAKAYSNIAVGLKAFTEAVMTVRGPQLIGRVDVESGASSVPGPKRRRYPGAVDYAGYLQAPFVALRDNMVLPLQPLMAQLEETFRPYSNNDCLNVLRAARWAASHGQVQQAYTLLQEFVVSAIHDRHKDRLGVIGDSRAQREYLSAVLACVGSRKKESEWKGDLRRHRELTQELSHTHQKIAAVYGAVANRRNDINHAGFRQRAAKPHQIREELDRLLYQVELWANHELG